jgi:hypothetical protein
MSITPVSDTPEYSQGASQGASQWASQGPRKRPNGLNPIIMSGWVTPSKNEKSSESEKPELSKPENDDIENPVKKIVCYLPYLPYVQTFDTDTEEERVMEERETCAILKRY